MLFRTNELMNEVIPRRRISLVITFSKSKLVCSSPATNNKRVKYNRVKDIFETRNRNIFNFNESVTSIIS